MAWFKNKRKEVLQEAADTYGGTYVDEGGFRGFWVEFAWRHLPLILDSHTQSTGKSAVTYDRLRVVFKAAAPFKLKIYKKSIFSGMAKALGAQDLLTGDAAFDAAFMVKGSDQDRVFDFFLEEALLRRMEQMSMFRVEITDRDPLNFQRMQEGELLLLIYALDRRRDVAAYGTMLDLGRQFLERMDALGIVQPEPPETPLTKPARKKRGHGEQ